MSVAEVRYFAAAGEAAGVSDEQVSADTLGALLTLVTQRHGPRLGSVLNRCSVLVDGSFSADPKTPLRADSQVDVLPPFAGG